MGQMTHRYFVFATASGFCAIAWNDVGVTRFMLPTASAEASERALLRRLPNAAAGTPAAEIMDVIALAKRYFAGECIDFSAIRVDLASADELFRAIYAATRRIEWGHTTTYGALAKELGYGPESARDVGQAMARNPVPLIIPCHRVLAAGGKIGGFSAPGGAATKLHMLELEGVRLEQPQRSQQSLGL
ncbi:MAG: methylated-DNA--[protein]-cysteine S-methyltransferase [Steroidobacteraceae bacterium]